MKFGKPLFRYGRVKPPALTFVSQRDGGVAQPLRELASLVGVLQSL